MAGAEYRPDRAGWDAVALSPQILAACMAEAERGKVYAVSIAPRSGDEQGRPYAESFEVEATTVDFGRGPRRVAAELRNTAPHAAAVEFGNRRTPRAQRVLGRTAAYLGGS